jgi:PAS domain S-box-containing protein
LHVIWRDITDQKAADKKVRYLASILEHVPDAVCSIDTEGRIVSWNEGAERMLGYKADEIIGRPIQSIIPEEKASEEVQHCIGELNKEGVIAGHETVRIAKDGRRVLVELSALALRDGQKITGYASIMRDITKRLGIEKVLAESEAKYRDLFENASDAVFVLDAELRYVDVNRRGLELVGYTREELLGRQPFDFVPEEQRPHSAAEFDKLRVTGSYETFEGRMLTKDGRWIDIEVSSTAIFRDGAFAGSRDIVRDITERKRIEENLIKRERQLSESQKVARIGSWSWNIADNTLEWSDETYRRFDKDPETFTPTTEYFVDRIHPEDREAVEKALQDSLKNDAPYHIQPRIINDSGREWVIEGFGILERDLDGHPLRFAGTAQDITERKQAEDALAVNQKFLDTIFETAPT